MTGSIIIRVDRQIIESGLINQAIEIIHGCSHNAETAKASFGAVSFFISGYDDDPRELWQIEEVRSWFTKLMDEVPHMLIFMNFDAQSVHLLLLSTCRLVDPMRQEIKGDVLKSWIQDRFVHVNFFLRSIGLLNEEPALAPWIKQFAAMIAEMTGQRR